MPTTCISRPWNAISKLKTYPKKIVSWEEEQYSTIDQTQNNIEEKNGTSSNKKFQVNYKDI